MDQLQAEATCHKQKDKHLKLILHIFVLHS